MQAGFLLHKPKTNVPAGESETYKNNRTNLSAVIMLWKQQVLFWLDEARNHEVDRRVG